MQHRLAVSADSLDPNIFEFLWFGSFGTQLQAPLADLRLKQQCSNTLQCHSLLQFVSVVYISIYLSIYLSTYLSIYLSIYMCGCV